MRLVSEACFCLAMQNSVTDLVTRDDDEKLLQQLHRATRQRHGNDFKLRICTAWRSPNQNLSSGGQFFIAPKTILRNKRQTHATIFPTKGEAKNLRNFILIAESRVAVAQPEFSLLVKLISSIGAEIYGRKTEEVFSVILISLQLTAIIFGIFTRVPRNGNPYRTAA